MNTSREKQQHSKDIIKVPKYTIKAKLGDPAHQFYPTVDVVQGGGSSYCPKNQQAGTLGVRVDRPSNSGFYYIATDHNFEGSNDYIWAYNSGGELVRGQSGKVIDHKYDWGDDGTRPILDCALIRLTTQSQKDITPGLYQGPNIPPLITRGTNLATPGMIVSKYGITTGLTYGRVIHLPKGIDKSYSNYLFAVERCSKNGYPMTGDFGRQGDSGAAVIDENWHVLGLFIQFVEAKPPDTLGVAFINRIDQIQAALNVTLHAD